MNTPFNPVTTQIMNVLVNETGLTTSVAFDEGDILWIDPYESISDPFLALLKFSGSTPIPSKDVCERWLDAYKTGDVEALPGLECTMKVISHVSIYPPGTTLTVTLDEPYGSGLNGFILPNGYVVESVKEAVECFILA